MARTLPAAHALTTMFKSRAIKKTYLAIVMGAPEPECGIICKSLQKSGAGSSSRRMICVNDSGGRTGKHVKNATTNYNVLERLGGKVSVVRLSPGTGRTHQLRAHMEAIGHPILGDRKYGHGNNALEGWPETGIQLHLHAHKVRFSNPLAGDARVEIVAPPPAHFVTTCNSLGLESWWKAENDTG